MPKKPGSSKPKLPALGGAPLPKKSKTRSGSSGYATKSGAEYADEASMVKESSVFFAISTSNRHPKNQQAGAEIIAGKTTKPEWRMTAIEKMAMVRKGVSKENLEMFKSKTNLDYDKLSAILSTTRATLINKKGTEQFSAALSERIVSIAEIYSYGFEVFGDVHAFNEWIFRSNQALGGKLPFELLDNQFGREEVKNLIGRIDYGVYS